MDQSVYRTISDKWNEILEFIGTEYDLTNVSYDNWIKPLVPKKAVRKKDGGIELEILCPDKTFINFVSRKYSMLIAVAIEEVTGIKLDPVFYAEEENERLEAEPIEKKNDVDPMMLANANLNQRYTFDSFVVGKNNQMAHAAALAVAEAPGDAFNPLFVYGGVGLGKTHLMHSIAHFILARNPKAKVLYVTSETFTNELIESIRYRNSSSTTEFRNKYRNNDVLLIDDIQFIIGKESTQEEFFHTFNSLYENKKQIVISSDKPPKEFETLEDRLRSRFESGLTVDIQPPDYETRMAILRKKEELDHINIDNEVIQYIATNIRSNIRELEGALNKIVFMSKLERREITVELAQEVLKDLISPDTEPEITPAGIIRVVAEHYGVSETDISGSKRNKEIVIPRQVAMYLCRNMTNASLQSIGECMGDRDHTTIINGIKKISTELKVKPELENTISILKKKISAH